MSRLTQPSGEHRVVLPLYLIRLSIHLFFKCYGSHRDLHSFPTRRSSDLSCCTRAALSWRSPRYRSAFWCRSRSSAGSASRSEEHTSELQSHSDLVCRLLLEKKNSRCRHVPKERAAEVIDGYLVVHDFT